MTKVTNGKEAKHFWISQGELHQCWRHAEGLSVRAYRFIGGFKRDLELGGYSAERIRPPAIFPEYRKFVSISDAKQWVIEIQH